MGIWLGRERLTFSLPCVCIHSSDRPDYESKHRLPEDRQRNASDGTFVCLSVCEQEEVRDGVPAQLSPQSKCACDSPFACLRLSVYKLSGWLTERPGKRFFYLFKLLVLKQ